MERVIALRPPGVAPRPFFRIRFSYKSTGQGVEKRFSPVTLNNVKNEGNKKIETARRKVAAYVKSREKRFLHPKKS